MRIFRRSLALICAATLFAGAAPGAWSEDGQGAGSASAVISASNDHDPRALFTHGFRAFQKGNIDAAVEALRAAASMGHTGARWKLGHMYATGEGVAEDDAAAFDFFRMIVRDQPDSANASSPDAAYVANAVVCLADYWRKGIAGSSVGIDLARARRFYFHAASYFGDQRAQFELGRMILNGEGGAAMPRQAARWLKLSMEKGNVAAKALLGSLLFDGRRINLPAQPVRGLTMMNTAMQEADEANRAWIARLRDEASQNASKTEREAALAQARQQVAMAHPSESERPSDDEPAGE